MVSAGARRYRGLVDRGRSWWAPRSARVAFPAVLREDGRQKQQSLSRPNHLMKDRRNDQWLLRSLASGLDRHWRGKRIAGFRESKGFAPRDLSFRSCPRPHSSERLFGDGQRRAIMNGLPTLVSPAVVRGRGLGRCMPHDRSNLESRIAGACQVRASLRTCRLQGYALCPGNTLPQSAQCGAIAPNELRPITSNLLQILLKQREQVANPLQIEIGERLRS
jgi:hypothetical protein